jgi:hypothetical protein
MVPSQILEMGWFHLMFGSRDGAVAFYCLVGGMRGMR